MLPWKNTIQLLKYRKSIPILENRRATWEMRVTLSNVLTVKHSQMEQELLGNQGQKLILLRQGLNKQLPTSNILMAEAKMLL